MNKLSEPLEVHLMLPSERARACVGLSTRPLFPSAATEEVHEWSLPQGFITKLWATHYELREFSLSIAYLWLEWLRMRSIYKQKFTTNT